MTRPRILLDEMLSSAIAEQLRKHTWDAVAVLERQQLIRMPDEDLLGAAASERRIVVTFNVSDFAAIARDWRSERRSHAGLIYIGSCEFPQNERLIGRIVRALTTAHEAGRLPSIDQELFLSAARH